MLWSSMNRCVATTATVLALRRQRRGTACARRRRRRAFSPVASAFRPTHPISGLRDKARAVGVQLGERECSFVLKARALASAALRAHVEPFADSLGGRYAP